MRSRSAHGSILRDEPARILVVAHGAAATPRRLEQVRARAKQDPCWFVLLVLPAQVERLGLPLTVVTAAQSDRSLGSRAELMAERADELELHTVAFCEEVGPESESDVTARKQLLREMGYEL